MAQETYTLAWILPYVREALKQTSNFEFRTYANALFFQLEKAQVQGVARFSPGTYSGGQTFQYEAMPPDLRALVSEAFFHLFQKGYIAPEAPDARLNPPALHMFRVTQHGRIWFQGQEPLPEDASRYMRFLKEQVPVLDSVIDQYIVEALIAYERESYFAAAVMVGAASEKAIYLLAASLLNALKPSSRRTILQTALNKRQLSALLDCVGTTIESESTGKNAPLPYSASEGASAHLASLFEAIRTQRNDAVHPMNATVSASSVRLLLHSFPYALSTTEKLRAWLDSNPGSL